MKIIASDPTGDPTVLEVNGLTFTRLSAPSPDADRVRIAVEALEVADDVLLRTAGRLSEYGKPHNEIDATRAAIANALAALSPAPEDKEAGR